METSQERLSAEWQGVRIELEGDPLSPGSLLSLNTLWPHFKQCVFQDVEPERESGSGGCQNKKGAQAIHWSKEKFDSADVQMLWILP